MEALTSSGFKEEFTYEPKMPNENNLSMNKENTKCSQKKKRKEKGKLYGSNPFL